MRLIEKRSFVKQALSISVLLIGFASNFAIAAKRTITDAVGNQQEWTYEEFSVRNLVTVKKDLIDGKEQQFFYDNQSNLISSIDPEGIRTNYEYNESNQLIRKIEAVGTALERETSFSYEDPNIDLVSAIFTPSVSEGDISVTSNEFDDDLNVISQMTSGYTEDGLSVARSTSYQYNDLGQLTQIDGPREDILDITTISYHDCETMIGGACGRLASYVDAVGHVTTYDVYDAGGLLLQQTDPNGTIITFDYDSRYRLVEMTATPVIGDVRVTTYTYDNVGQVLTMTTPDNIVITNTYNAAHYLVSSEDNFGDRIEYYYDLKGNLVRTTVVGFGNDVVRTIERAYDHRNFVTEINNGGSITQMVRDAVGNVVGHINPNGNQASTNSFDALHRLLSSENADSGITTRITDAQDHIVQVTSPNGATTSYVYDDLDNLLEEVSPDRGRTVYFHDAAGNIVTKTDARGFLVHYAYDELNRLLIVDYPGAEEDISYTYDQYLDPVTGQNCEYGVNRVCRVVDQSGETTFSYDPWGNTTEVRWTPTGLSNQLVTSYQYDAGDRVIGIGYPDGRNVTITRDVVGRLTGITTLVDDQATDLISNRTYRADGLNLEHIYGNGIIESKGYDLRGQLVDQTTLDTINRTYDYDPNGNLESLTDIDGVRQYSYDALDRLADASLDGLNIDYGYDPNGNRLSLTENGSVDTLDYTPASNRLSLIDNVAIGLDPAGNTISDQNGNRLFEYNQAGRLSRVLVNNVEVARYEYNARGLRAKKITPTATTLYKYDLSGKLLVEQLNGGAEVREYIYADSEPVAMIVGEDEAIEAGEVVNLALDGVASHFGYSGDIGYRGWVPSKAIDGNTPGTDYSHSSGAKAGWFQVDLVGVYLLDSVNIWNKTGTQTSRLQDYYILVSSQPMLETEDLNNLLGRSDVTAFYQAEIAGRPTAVDLGGIYGRYVRLALSIKNPVHISELEVFGTNPNAGQLGLEEIDDVTLQELTQVQIQPAAIGSFLDDISYSALGLPSGLSIDPVTGLISGVIDSYSAGSYSVTVVVANASTSASESFEIDVIATSLQNLALSGVASQFGYSGDDGYNGRGASRAIDGNTAGNDFNNSSGAQPGWWQVDLLGSYYLNYVNIWNKTGANRQRLQDYYILVSSQPMLATEDLDDLLGRSDVTAFYQAEIAVRPTLIDLGGINGRYVRLAMVNRNPVHISEFEVFGQ